VTVPAAGAPAAPAFSPGSSAAETDTAAASAGAERRARLARAVPFLVGASVLALGLLLIDALPVGVVHDDGMYVILAKSLATGQGFRWLNVPGAPPATHFPPGYPAVLALVWKLVPAFPRNVIAFKALNALFLALIAAGMVVYARRRLGFGDLGAAALALAGTAAIPMLTLSTLVMSEAMFLALLVPLLLAAERAAEREDASLTSLVALGAAAGALTLVRAHAVALVGALVLVLAIRRRWRGAAAAGVAAFVAMLPWQLWSRAHTGFVPDAMRGNYESYTAWLVRGFRADGIALLPRTVERTGATLLSMLASVSALRFPVPLRIAALVVVLLLLVIGAARLARLAPVTALFLAAYVAIVLAWPFEPTRFIWGIWALFIVVPVVGAAVVVGWHPSAAMARGARAALLGGVALVAFGYARYNVIGYQGNWWSSISRVGAYNIRPLVNWVRGNTKPGDVVMTNAEPMVYLYGGRASLPATSFTVDEYFRPVSVEASAAALREILHFYKVDAVAVATADSLMAAAHAMSVSNPPELVPRDTFMFGVAYSPNRP
jgi:hypothetical protein